MQPDRACYIERLADEQLIRNIANQRFCYVLSPRATGKSSLVGRVIKSLRSSGQLAAVVNLSQIGARGDRIDAGRWYYSVAYRVVRELRLKVELHAWWQSKSALTSDQRFAEFFLEIVLGQTSVPVTIFVDEIERVVDLPFRDELFAMLHGCYGRRVSEPDLGRLNFVVLGVATPAGLCAEPSVSPFPDGRAIELEDFTAEECHGFAAGFPCDRDAAFVLLDKIYAWTHGQPYLTQKVARGVVRKGSTPEAVDRVVHEQFLAPSVSREEPLLSHIRRMLNGDSAGTRQALSTLVKLARARDGVEEANAAARDLLQLSGIVLADDKGRLSFRNAIFASVFDASWARSAAPFNWRLSAAVAAAVVLCVAVPFWYTQVLPRPYVATLSADAVGVGAAQAAYRGLARWPGFGGKARRLLSAAMSRYSQRAATLQQVVAADAVLRALPQEKQTAERLLAQYWLRRAHAAMNDENRGRALLFALAAIPGRGDAARALAAELIGADYPRLQHSIQLPAVPAHWAVDWRHDRLTVIDEAHHAQRFSFSGEAVPPPPLGADQRLAGRLTALQLVPVSRQILVDGTGAAGAFDLTLDVEHPRPGDLMLTVSAPSGAQASFPVPSAGVGRRMLRFDARPGAPLAALTREDRQGEWRLDIVDRRGGETGVLHSWSLEFPSTHKVWRDAPEEGVPLPDPARTEQVDVTLSKDGRYALARPTRPGAAGAVTVWNLANGRVVSDLPFKAIPAQVLFNADASRVISFGAHAVTIWNARDGKPITRLTSDDGFVLVPALSPAGALLAVAERTRAGAVRIELLGLADGRRIAEFDAAPDTRAMVLGPAGRYVALLGAGRTVDVRDPRGGRKLMGLPHQRAVVRLLPVPGTADELVSIDSEGDVYQWKLANADGSRRRYLGSTVDPASASIAAGGSVVAFEAAHGRVVLRALGGARAVPYRIDRSAVPVMTRLAPDGTRMLTVNGRRLRLWGTGSADEPVMQPALSALAIDRGGSVAALGFRSGNVRVRRPGQPDRVTDSAQDVDFIGHRGRVTCLAVNAANGRIASGGEDGVVRVWDLASAAPTPHFLRHPEGPIHAVDISRDGKWIASAAEYSARVWGTDSGKLVGEVPVNGAALSVAFSPQDDTLAVGDSAGNIFFGAPRGSTPLHSTRADAAVTAVAFSGNGDVLASGDRQGDVQLWNAGDGTVLADAKSFHHAITWLGFGADGSIFVRSGDWIHQLRADGRSLKIAASRLLPLGFDVDAVPAAPIGEQLRIFGVLGHGATFYTVDMNTPTAPPLAPDSQLLRRNWADILGLRFDRSTGAISTAP